MYHIGSFIEMINQSIIFNLKYYSRFGDISHSEFTDLPLYDSLTIYLNFIITNTDITPFYPTTRMLFDRLITLALIFCFMIQLIIGNRLYGSFLLFFTVLQRLRPVYLHEESYYILSFFSLIIIINWLYITVRSKDIAFGIKYVKYLSSFAIFIIFFIMLITGILCINIVNTHPISIDPCVHYIQKYSAPSDKLFASPLDPSIYLDSKRLPATKFYGYVPWQVEPYGQEIIKDLQKNSPKILVVDMGTVVWGYKFSDYAGDLISNFISKEYKQYVFFDGYPHASLYINNNYMGYIKKYYPQDILGCLGVSQEAATQPVGEILGNMTIGQTFLTSEAWRVTNIPTSRSGMK
jgi:hypothetical protein